MSTLAVVITSHDRRESLLHTLDRLAELPERPQVVVVDNGSSDGTPGAVRRRHPRARVVEAPGNLGAAARTLGARVADAPHIAFSDDDSWWAPGALSYAERLFARHRRLGLIAARIHVEPGARLDPTCIAMAHSPLPRDPALPGPAVLGFVGCGAVMRRSAFLGCGGFDRRLWLGGEEHLLALDLAAAGWGLAYVEEVIAHHRPAPSAERADRARRLLRNALWTAWLRRPLPVAARHTAKLLTDQGGMAAAVGLAAALRGLPWVVRERRPVPHDVERSIRLLEETRPALSPHAQP
jgi:GT2 family glycosyltransferase